MCKKVVEDVEKIGAILFLGQSWLLFSGFFSFFFTGFFACLRFGRMI